MKLTVVLVLCLVVVGTFAKGGMDEGDDEYDQMEVRRDNGEQQEYKNPCNKHACKRGEVCHLKDAETAECVCQTCENEAEDAIKVCSTKNVTYNNECELDRDHCLCKHGHDDCPDKDANKVRLDYFAACKELTKCPEDEFKVFPERMRNWLYRIMKELDDRMDLAPEYRESLVSARQDEDHTDAIIWKFCDLDADPEDRKVTRRELMYIIASIKPMEHCLVRFLNTCDENDDNSITLEEWGKCLQVHRDHLEAKCAPIHKNRN